jgi:putative ABC transport system permease protein
MRNPSGWRRLFRLAESPAHNESSDSEEIRFHFEELVARYRREGLGEAEAEDRARARLGAPEDLQAGLRAGVPARYRRRRWHEFLSTLRFDLRLGQRSLRRAPLFSLLAVLTLALGIGSATVIFSVVNAVLIRPLPYPDAGELVQVMQRAEDGSGSIPVSQGLFLALREQATTLTGLAAADFVTFEVSGGEVPVQEPGIMTTGDLFTLLGARPALGRFFTREEERAGSNGVAVLSYATWQSLLGGDPGVIGRRLRVSPTYQYGPPRNLPAEVTVIGVLPEDFVSPYGNTRIFTPLGIDEDRINMAQSYLWLLGRLRPGDSIESARGELDVILQGTDPELRGTRGNEEENEGVSLTPLWEIQRGYLQNTLRLFFAAVGLLLLVGCANIANLLLARGAGRDREMAVRLALGASRLRLVRILLGESLLLAGAGIAAGLGLAWGGIRLLVSVYPSTILQRTGVGLDPTVLLFAAGAGALSVLLFGLVPALQTSRVNLAPVLHRSGRALSAGRSQRRLRSVLLVVEVALAVVLTTGTALLLRSLHNMMNVPFGFEPRELVLMQLPLDPAVYPEREQRLELGRRLAERIAALPEVAYAGSFDYLPFEGAAPGIYFRVPDHPDPERQQPSLALLRTAGPGALEALGATLLAGRWFEEGDWALQPQVAIIDRVMAEQYWPDGDAVGRQLEPITQTPWPPVTVVGVVENMRLIQFVPDGHPGIILPTCLSRSAGMVVRTRLEPENISALLRGAVAEIDPAIFTGDIRFMESVLQGASSTERFRAILLSLFGGLTLLLALVGVYGVHNYTVAQRTHELGLRMTLGARRAGLLRLVLLEAAGLSGLGILIGTGTALALNRLIRGFLFDMSPTDTVTYAGVALAILVVTGLAGLIPAWRAASRVDPMMAMRVE